MQAYRLLGSGSCGSDSSNLYGVASGLQNRQPSNPRRGSVFIAVVGQTGGKTWPVVPIVLVASYVFCLRRGNVIGPQADVGGNA